MLEVSVLDLPLSPSEIPAALMDSDLQGSLPALVRSAASARARAIQTRTGIVVHRAGGPVFVPYEELLASAPSSANHQQDPT